jgi:hypothetical protein
MTPEQMTALAVPFPPEHVKQVDKGFGPVDYVDHAHVTERLNQVIPGWTWEPMGRTEQGLPAFDDIGGLWIWLELPDGTKVPGYGEPGQRGHDAIKGAISDAIKNAAMRLGVALDLWKGTPTQRVQVSHDVKQPMYPPRNPARKQASQKATEKQVGFARLLIDTVDEGSEVAAQILGSEPLELADKATVSALIEDLKARKEAAAEKVTRSKGQVEDDWHLQPEPEEIPF